MPVVKKRNQQTESRLLLESDDPVELPPAEVEDSAVVTGRLSARGRTEGGEFSFRQRYTRVYVKREEGWQAVAAQVTVVSGA